MLVQIDLDLESHQLDLDTIIPCGLIINELITNSLKHAFPAESKGNIRIKFSKVNDEYTLAFSDNGIGVKSKIDFENIHTLGLKLVDLLVKQLHGSLELEPREKGVGFIIRFKE
jgi:two-component sensor histidine kinase